ncbi:adenosine deaminase [Pelomyxa schiedti]|nr:adenosine deaminase [Pelomyxa schiedti]
MKRFGGSGSEQVTTSSRGAVTGEWCRGIPKAELHAHLGGCVRLATLVELAADRGIDTSQASLHHHINSDGCNMTSVELESVYASCFRLFDIIHKAVDTTERVARVAAEAVSDFAADNVKYIELRTTPRELGARTKRDYIDGVLNSMSEACSASGVAADLVLSVSRDQDPVDAMSTVELAAEYFNNRDCGSGSHHASVVGVELSGNPYSRAWSEMAPSLDRARACGIPISLHFAEKESDSEALAMLSSRPNRVGHAVYVSRNSEVETQLLTQQVPVELCLTSNVATKRIPSAAHHSFASHVLGTEYQSHTLYPVAFCTDDPGVFCSSSSNEHLQAATAFGLTRSRVAQSSLHALEFSFALPAVKDKLRPLFHSSLNP